MEDVVDTNGLHEALIKVENNNQGWTAGKFKCHTHSTWWSTSERIDRYEMEFL